MKVFFPVIALYPSQIGGPCNAIYWHTCELCKSGINPRIITTSIGIAEGDVVNDKMLNAECGSVVYNSKVLSFNVLKLIYKEVSDNKIIHINGLFNLYSLTTFILTFFISDRKLIVSPRGELNKNALKFNSWKKKIFVKLYKLNRGRFLFHATSKLEENDIIKVLDVDNVINIPNLLYPSKRLGLSKKKQILYMGRLHPIKKIENLILGFSYSKEIQNKHFKLIIAGAIDIRYEEYYHSLVSLVEKLDLTSEVEFIGHIEGKAKEVIYSESYAMALMSETENFGNVVVEALNQGTPVLSSIGTPWDILESYNCGFHIDNKPEIIGETLDELLLKSKDEYSQMCQNAVELVDERFNVKTQIFKWVEIYESLNNEK